MKHFNIFLAGILSLLISSCGSSGSSGSGDSSTGNKNNNTTVTGQQLSGSDPLYSQQWYFNNVGQKVFTYNPGEVAMDINPNSTYRSGIYGRNVEVAVVDSGLELNHEDLRENISKGKSWNFKERSSNPTNIYENDGDHGTSVSGLIAAVAGNDKGGRGVAPLAKLRGYNILNSNAGEQLGDQVKALGGGNPNFNSSDVDIFNLSYGTANTSVAYIEPEIEAQYEYGVKNLRNGKGAIYVKSAGNGFYSIGRNTAVCTKAKVLKITCQNSNMVPAGALPWTLVVGAYNATGKKSSYSTTGSSLWVSAPGGEFGVTYPAMVTTDQSGCAEGYSRDDAHNPKTQLNQFEGNYNGLNDGCNYTSTFNGTSSAAPVTSGAIALMLEANPDLYWQQILDILARTSSKREPLFTPISVRLSDGQYIAENGWITNSAGFSFHNWYGFGAIDVDAAVEMAKTVKSAPRALKEIDWKSSGDINRNIPDNSRVGVTNDQNIDTDLKILTVLIEVDVEHSNAGELGVELFSPSNTKSILLNIRNGFDRSDNLNKMRLRTNAFYGESSAGEWRLKVVDGSLGSSGKLKSWKIKILGTES